MLFPSTLVVSDNLDSITPILKNLGHFSVENNPDVFLVSEYSIDHIRTINNFLSLSPYSHTSKIVVIPQAHLLNIESQNTLLKNLEEPGANNYFILITTRPNALISTILSRCQIIKDQPAKSLLPAILKFPKSIAECLSLSETLPKDKVELLTYLNQQIELYQQELIKDPSATNSRLINKLIKATQMLPANIDPKSVTDFLLLS